MPYNFIGYRGANLYVHFAGAQNPPYYFWKKRGRIIARSMTSEQQLREKLRKITALFEGAKTAGERQAAAAALERIRQALQASDRQQAPPPLVELKFTMADQWQRRLFTALCRRYGFEPYRYKRQRHMTIMIRAPRDFVKQVLWPEYEDLQSALHDYLSEATDQLIRDQVHRGYREAAG